MRLKIVCAWCQKTIEVKEIDCKSTESEVSHGICEKCKDKALEELQEKKIQNQERR